MAQFMDDLGAIYDNDVLIGTYDPDTQICTDLNNRPITCPSDKPTTILQPKVESKRTYYWLIFLFIALIIIGLVTWYIWNKKLPSYESFKKN